jgi:putative holliday junction resolvase
LSKIIGIDFGMARIGLAISDASKFMAFPFCTIQAGKSHQETLKTLLAEVSKEPCEEFVIGLPLLMNGRDSEMSLLVRDFAKSLEEETSKKVHLWDERLTSKEIEKLLIQGDVKRKKRSKMLDTLSATLILQSFMDVKKNNSL